MGNAMKKKIRKLELFCVENTEVTLLYTSEKLLHKSWRLDYFTVPLRTEPKEMTTNSDIRNLS